MRLTDEQITEARSEVVSANETKPCRFLINGQALNIVTGELCSKGSNVIYHTFYPNFTKETANKIAGWLGAKVVWSK